MCVTMMRSVCSVAIPVMVLRPFRCWMSLKHVHAYGIGSLNIVCQEHRLSDQSRMWISTLMYTGNSGNLKFATAFQQHIPKDVAQWLELQTSSHSVPERPEIAGAKGPLGSFPALSGT